jgi:hypothetical protein
LKSNEVVTILSTSPSYCIAEPPECLALDDKLLICKCSAGLSSKVERKAIATCSLVSNVWVLDAVTQGDAEAGLSCHASLLTTMFRTARDVEKKRTILIGVVGTVNEEALVKNIMQIYKSIAIEVQNTPSFEQAYDLQIVSVESPLDVEQVRPLMFLFPLSQNHNRL